MVKGVSIKFQSYAQTVPKLLQLIKLENELKKHNTIILKPFVSPNAELTTPVAFVEQVLKYCMDMKNPETEIFIAEGADGENTLDLFDEQGYRQLSEKYGVGLMDLNNAEVEEVRDGEFLKFDKIMYPKILMNSFIISLPKLAEVEELEINGSLANMLGAFPARYYKGLFSSGKSKIKKWPLKYSVHDILKVRSPQLAIIDASEKSAILAGKPIEIDKQAARLLGKDWRAVTHLRLMDESFANSQAKQLTAANSPKDAVPSEE